MKSDSVQLLAPTFKDGGKLLIAGLSERYQAGKVDGIPLQWQSFVSFLGRIGGQVSGETYGVCYNGDNNGWFDYLSGVEVATDKDLASEFTTLAIPEQHYAVFAHQGPVHAISATMDAIWKDWLPKSGRKFSHGPLFEKYAAQYNPQTDLTGVEIWLPVEA